MNITPLILVAITLLAMDVNVNTKEKLAVCRKQIDSIDQRIAQLIQDRARVVNEVRRIKKEAHLPVAVADREENANKMSQVLAKGDPIPPDAVGRSLEIVVEEMRDWETKLDSPAQ